MTLRTTLDRINIAVVDLYLARGRLRAEIPMHGFSRLSDLFNNAPGEFIAAHMRLSTVAEEDISVVRRELVVRLRDVRLVRPIEERQAAQPSATYRDSVQARVVFDLDDWQVTGSLYLMERVRWLDFLVGMRNRFIAVSDASVRFVGVAEPLECEYLLVNGACISALHEAD